ncbi:MAG: nitroreductase family protein [Candidatus Aenigmarchaeota archaeon]|nr:nitroreductase family protein [Candidatus Aenigmarchaeota archaeon]NIQ17538.1 nitroreductase family protein [Candidatus Aenigmarchaeota archaeon]NIS73116.1 nitroreductase family protein [Candidatus Aenigmarchaeota archaeon]
MELGEAIRNRRSIRSYTDRPVEDEKIEKILDAAHWAPSAGNLQSVEYIVVKDREIKNKLAEASYGQAQPSKAPVNIVVCVNYPKISHYGERGETLYSIQESGACIQNLMLTAHSLGLGTCWIGAFDEGKAKGALGIPDHVRPVGIITLGYPDESPRSSRRGLKEVVFKEKYKG